MAIADREDRAAQTKAAVARRERLAKARSERERRRKSKSPIYVNPKTKLDTSQVEIVRAPPPPRPTTTREDAERRRGLAREADRIAKKAGTRRVGDVEEDFSFRTADGRSYDPERGKVVGSRTPLVHERGERDAPTARTALGSRDTPGKDARDERRTARRERLERARQEREVRRRAKAAGINPGALDRVARVVGGDIKQIGYGVADAAADYGTAVTKDVIGGFRGKTPKRTTNLLLRDAEGLVRTVETMIPDPTDAEDRKRAWKFWREDPLIGFLTATPAVSTAARQASRGALEGSIGRANPALTRREVRRAARQESKLPGRAAAHGIKGGIGPRMIEGEYGSAVGRPWSRTPIGRAGQRAYDRASKGVEARFGPGAKWSSSKRVMGAHARKLDKERARTGGEIALLEREQAKGIGKRGRDTDHQLAMTAALEGPRGVTPRQAVEMRLADLRHEPKRKGKPAPESKAVKRASQRVESLSRRLEREQGRVGKRRGVEGTSPFIERERPRTPEEAKTRLAELEKWKDDTLAIFMREGAFDPSKVKRAADSQARREAQRVARNKNVQRTREGVHPSTLRAAYGGPSFAQRKVQEADAQFSAWVDAKLKQYPDNETLRRTRQQLDEIDELRTAIAIENERGTFAEGMTTGEASLGREKESVYDSPYSPRVRKIAGALSIARDELETARKRAATAHSKAEGKRQAAFDKRLPKTRQRREAQAAALERVLAGDRIDSPEFERGVQAAEALAARAEASLRRTFPDIDEETLAARRNLIVRRYAERGLLPQGVEPEARGFFPHRDEFESVPGSMGAPTFTASGSVVGRPKKGRAFETRRNELRLYEEGRVQTNPRVLSNTARQRARFEQTQEARGILYDVGDRIDEDVPLPEGRIVLIRNPKTDPETIPPAIRTAVENPDEYASLASRSGDTPSAGAMEQFVDTWLWRPQKGKTRPEWASDLENVRAVPEALAKTLLTDVFQSAPRGSMASLIGALNALSRMNAIYLPYAGARYVVRSSPQNMILLALTQPKAFLRMRKVVTTMRTKHNAEYEAWKAETGKPQAAAGLPELPGARRSRGQRVEGALTDVSRGIANRLGNITDEPWRIAAAVQYAREYGFKTPQERWRLLTSDDPNLVRVRDDIAQRVRDDMLDFDALPHGLRENLSRAFFILPFKYAATKWPAMYVREYPTRAAILALIAAQHEREETPGRKTSVLESGRTEIGGRETDLGWLLPHMPSAEIVQDAVTALRDVRQPTVGLRSVGKQLGPQYKSLIDAMGGFGEPREQIAGWAVPGFSTGRRIAKGGSLTDQTLRFLGSDADYIERAPSDPRAKIVEESRKVISGLRAKRPDLVRENPTLIKRIKTAYSRKTIVDVMRDEVEDATEPGIEREREKLRRETALLRSWGVLSPKKATQIAGVARNGSLDDVKEWRDVLREEGFEAVYLGLLREASAAALEE